MVYKILAYVLCTPVSILICNIDTLADDIEVSL